MAEPTFCPHCGQSLPPDGIYASGPIVFAPEATRTVETLVPVTSHGEECGPACAAAAELYPPVEHGEAAFAAGSPPRRLRDSDEFATNGSGSYDPLASPVADPLLDVFASASRDVEPASRPAPTAHDEGEPEGRSWLLVLLGSYASAMTIAVAWLLWHGYGRAATIRDTMPTPTRGSDAGRARELPPIPDGNRIGLGKTFSLGDVDFAPLSLRVAPVVLESVRPDGSTERQEGGTDCLILTVAFKRLGKASDTPPPLELAAVRQSDASLAPSCIEAPDSIIESFPLALTSERRIVGQDFGPPAPWGSTTTILASEPDARGRLTGPAVWRIPLRHSDGRTVTVGVEISPEDLR